MLCCVWKIKKMFWQIPHDSEPRQPPQLITTVSNIVWNVAFFLRAEDTQLIWLPANSSLALIAASNKWAKSLHQFLIAHLTLARLTRGPNWSCQKRRVIDDERAADGEITRNKRQLHGFGDATCVWRGAAAHTSNEASGVICVRQNGGL